jgi:hypothetical protein
MKIMVDYNDLQVIIINHFFNQPFLDNYLAGYILKKIPLAIGPTIIN